MKKFKNPPVEPVEEAPKYQFDFEIINKQIDSIRQRITTIGKDGIISSQEQRSAIIDLQVLERMLAPFMRKEDRSDLNTSRRAFNGWMDNIHGKGKFALEDTRKYGFIADPSRKDYNLQIAYSKHILEYLGILINVAHYGGFITKNG